MGKVILVAVFITSLHLSLSKKCNVNLVGVPKEWSTVTTSVPLKTTDGLDKLKEANTIRIVKQNIPILCKHSVKDLNKLNRLDLSSNGIENIEPEAFSNVDEMHHLTLMRNKLKQIRSGVFNNLRLTTLELGENQIEFIDEGAFDNMSRLGILDISRNKITAINREWFKNTPNIGYLDLGHNLITTLEENNFKNLHGKQVLNGRSIDIYLNNNKISTVNPKAFNGLQELGMLFLDHNDISTLHEDTFRDLERIVSLSLMFNKIECLPMHFENILKGHMTLLENNPWNCTCVERLQQQIKRSGKTYIVDVTDLKCKSDKL